MKMKPDQHLLIFSMGKALRVTAIFDSVDAANEYCEKRPDEGVIAEFKPYVFLANLYDPGVKCK